MCDRFCVRLLECAFEEFGVSDGFDVFDVAFFALDLVGAGCVFEVGFVEGIDVALGVFFRDLVEEQTWLVCWVFAEAFCFFLCDESEGEAILFVLLGEDLSAGGLSADLDADESAFYG